MKAGAPVEPLEGAGGRVDGVVKETLTDQGAAAAHLPPGSRRGSYKPGDAELDVVSGILTGGKNSRLYKRLVYTCRSRRT